MQAQEGQTSPSPKPSPQAQALAQQSTKGKTQEDAKADSKTKNQDKSKKKSKKEKQDLITKIDSQLAKLKSKNKSKAKETDQQKYIEDDDSLDMADTKADQDNTAGSHYDLDADEYAVNHPEINYRLDHGFPKGGRGERGGRGRDGFDLYDVFKDFDKDGDGIVDDIDFEDAHWKDNCNKNGFDPYDDNTFKQGRYRGLTDEEWSKREATHQHNLDELEKKQSELEKAHGDVHDALSNLSTEKESIDKEIKDKVLETEKLRVEFRKREAERAAAERAAAMEREKAIMTER